MFILSYLCPLEMGRVLRLDNTVHDFIVNALFETI